MCECAPSPQVGTKLLNVIVNSLLSSMYEKELGVPIARTKFTEPNVHIIEPFCSLLITLVFCLKVETTHFCFSSCVDVSLGDIMDLFVKDFGCL
jgi:hypothetical protein